MRSRKERGARSEMRGRVVVVSCRRFTTKARRHKESGFRFKSHSRNTPVAALPPDVRKGSAFPTRPLNHLHNGEAEPRHCVELLWLASRKAGGLPHIRRSRVRRCGEPHCWPDSPSVRKLHENSKLYF